MPMAIPLIIGGLEMFAGAAAAAALVGGEITLATVAGGLMFAGGALTTVGTLTKNDKLVKIGTVAALAGGVGSLVNMGLEAATAATVNAAEATLPDVAELASETQAPNPYTNWEGGAQGPMATGGATPPPGIIEGATDAAAAPGSPPVPQVTESPVKELIDTGSAPKPPEPSTPIGEIKDPIADLTQTVTKAPDVPDVPGYGSNNPTDAWKGTSQSPGKGLIAGNSSSVSDALSSAGKWVKDNKELANVAGYMTSGAMKSMSDQDLLKTKIALEEQMRQRQRKSHSQAVQGLAMPTYVPPPGGMGQVRPLPTPQGG